MKMKSFAGLSVLLLSLAAATAQAGWDIDGSNLRMPPPPAPGSAADKKDFQILLHYQETRTDEQCRAADAQSRLSIESLFGPDTGVLTSDEIAKIETFAEEVADTVEKAAKPFKQRFHRARPYDEDSEIQPCVSKPGGHTSYPSSHAAIGQALGDLLAQIFPDKADKIRAEGTQIGDNRVLGGVHHPTDVIAGRKLAQEIEIELMKDADFLREFNALKQ